MVGETNLGLNSAPAFSGCVILSKLRNLSEPWVWFGFWPMTLKVCVVKTLVQKIKERKKGKDKIKHRIQRLLPPKPSNLRFL